MMIFLKQYGWGELHFSGLKNKTKINSFRNLWGTQIHQEVTLHGKSGLQTREKGMINNNWGITG